MKYLITGGCGFIGSNLASEVIRKNEDLFVLDNLYRHGTIDNLDWLRSLGEFKFYHTDIRSCFDVENVIKDIQPDVIFHLAGQVAMTTSIENPRMDFEVNSLGTLNVLEAVRKYSKHSIILYSSTNKVYGDLEQYRYEEEETRYKCLEHPNGFDESVPLDFHSPYGCSKGTADQYLLDYDRIFGVRTVVFRHSSMYGGRQFSTADQGWIGWFCKLAMDIKNGVSEKPFEISGSGKQVRDVLYSSDVANLYFIAAEKIAKIHGQVFNIGGGMKNSLSLLELFALLEGRLKIKMRFNKKAWRESDQKVFVADNKRITAALGWAPLIGPEEGIANVIKWLDKK